MSDELKKLVYKTLARFDIGITRNSHLQQLRKSRRAAADIDMILALPEHHTAQLLRSLKVSNAQFRQDLFVLSALDFKRGGYFVEFGATDGVFLSNTYLLEKEYGWRGILAEPSRRWHEQLAQNRSCHIETNCVWKDSSSVLTFIETENAECSAIDSCGRSRWRKNARKHGHACEMRTISLEDMLEKYKAPKKIDYLSVDTEGSEYEILSSFDFGKYRFEVITVEHCFKAEREKIFTLLTENGYTRKLDPFSGLDDWYVPAS